MDTKNYLDKDGLLYYDKAQKARLEKKVDKEFKTGSQSEYKVLSDNNLTDELVEKIRNAGTGSFTGNYDDLYGIPTLDGTEIKGTLTKSELDIASAYALLQTDGNVANAMADIEEMKRDYATQDWVTQKGYQTSSEVDEKIDAKISSTFTYKGSVETYDELQSKEDDAKIGDVWDVKDTGMNYAWTGSEWDALGSIIDLSDYVREDELIAITNQEIESILNEQ